MCLLNGSLQKAEQLKQEFKVRFETSYENLLMKHYIQAFQDMKELKDLFKKEASPYLKQTLVIKKGVFLESLLRLSYLIYQETYPTTKWLLQLTPKEIQAWTKGIVEKILSVQTYEDFILCEKEIKHKINIKAMTKDLMLGYDGCF